MRANSSLSVVRTTAILAAAAFIIAIANRAVAQQSPAAVNTVHVDTTPAHIINSFDPDTALGAWFDVSSKSEIDNMFTTEGIKAPHEWGWGTVTMRNNSDLSGTVWHWTENGTWSDPAHKSGYFTGSADLKDDLRYVYSYNIPNKGMPKAGDPPNADGTPKYWKSNPYLASNFTGESDALHPQWVVVDMGIARPVNAIHIAWVNPYATVFAVQYWIGDKFAMDFDMGPNGVWQPFPNGNVSDGKGGDVTLKLSDEPITTRWVRLLMTQSSNTPDTHGADDIRNCVGYAIHTVDVGTVDAGGKYAQVYPLLLGAPEPPAPLSISNVTGIATPGGRSITNSENTRGGIMTSSSDVWHEESDIRNANGYTHVGLDLFFKSGLANGNPALYPVTCWYGTPDDAANEVAYVAKRGYSVLGVEIGEEPDGQRAMPDDYAALYCQWATAIHKLTPNAKLGGPIFEGVNKDLNVWPNADGQTSWMGRFVTYLKNHGHLADLSFVSFEHYPMYTDYIGPPETWNSLYLEPGIIRHVMAAWRADGVPANVPLIISESGMDAGSGSGLDRGVAGAIWECDAIGAFLADGGATFIRNSIHGGGGRGGRGGTPVRSSSFWADNLLNLDWLQHKAGVHQMFPASTDLMDPSARTVVTTYAVHRPDDNWSIMLVNRDEDAAHDVRVEFADADGKKQSFAGPVDFITFGSEQFAAPAGGRGGGGFGGGGRGAATRGGRRAGGGGAAAGGAAPATRAGAAGPNGPPKTMTVTGGPDATYTLPKASVTILRGKLQ